MSIECQSSVNRGVDGLSIKSHLRVLIKGIHRHLTEDGIYSWDNGRSSGLCTDGFVILLLHGYSGGLEFFCLISAIFPAKTDSLCAHFMLTCSLAVSLFFF